MDFTTDDLSNWYVRLNRKRFWRGEYNRDKQAAYQTLYTCLVTIAKLGSPVAPFYMENLYRDLNAVTGKDKAESVHLCDFPVADEGRIDTLLEAKMQKAQTISSLVHSLRKKDTIKVRQPLSRILIPILNKETQEQIQAVEDLILSEVNIKAIEYIDDTSGVLVKKIKPNFPKLGKQYGPKMKEISQAVAKFGQEDIAEIEQRGQKTIAVSDGQIILTREDVDITSEDIPGWSVASENGLTVALDITISDELRQEGIARDLVNRVQNLRKDMGLEVQDKINIQVEKGDELVNAALEANRDYICTETQANTLELQDSISDATELDMDELKLKVKIEVRK